jgi:hypothetical protein
VIVLPLCLLEPDGRGALRAVLAHELGHLKRRDHWAAWIDLLTTTVFWWLPTAWIAGRAMERASDEAADACAARALGSRRTYAASLIETLEVLTWNQTPFALPGRGLGAKEAVERRLVMVLRQPLFTGLSLRSRVALVALGLLLLPAAAGPAPGQEAAPGEPARIPEIAPVAALPASADEPAVPAVPVAPPAPVAPALPRARPPSADDYGIPAPPPGGAGSSYGLRGGTGGNAGYALGSPDDAPRNVEERLSDVERKVDRLLREMERLTRAVAPGPSAATGGTRGRDPDSPAYSPRPVTPRAANRPARTGAGTQSRQVAPADPLPRERGERLKSIERRFEERARALRKELADLEAALEAEMKAATERDPDDGGGDALEDEPRDPVPVPEPQPAPRVPGALNLPGTPGAPPQPGQPAQPRAIPGPARN